MQFYYVICNSKVNDYLQISTENSLNAIVFKLQLNYSTEKNLKVAIAQLWNVQVCNFVML